QAARRGRRRLVGPWDHNPGSPQVGEVNFGPAAVSPIVDETQVRFFDWHLKGEDDGISREPPINLCVMGDNAWRDEWEWPPKRALGARYYLHSDGFANSMHGDGT